MKSFQRLPIKPRGFALVVTVSLMVLLTLLALGLLGLSSISLRTSSQGAAMAEARSNARMALMLAIGQLQRELGPDSRISAPHGLADGNAGGRPHWTAVYDAWKIPEGPGNPRDTPESRTVTFREWLVSGNTGTTQSGGLDDVLLVGPGTLGTGAAPEDVVRVPFHDVNAVRGNGRIAWWTSDEGMKAKINAGPATNSLPAQVSNPVFHAQSPPHPDHQAFPALRNFQWKGAQRELALSIAQANLTAGLGQAGLGNAFHDLTVHSEGVLADVRTGRLKRDLTQLLSRPIAELEDKPLYLADGRINRFDIRQDGTVSNLSFVRPWNSSRFSPDEWGINLEELALYHNIHKEIDWTGGVPALVTKDSVDALALDRFGMYRRHVIEAMQFIFSLQAVPSGGTTDAPTYKMQLMLDGMVVLANPNDVRLRFPPGLVRAVVLESIAYDAKLKITKADTVTGGTTIPGSVEEQTTIPPNARLFTGFIEGGFGGTPAAGFELEPGEAATFGSTKASGFNLNLRRGFVPSGGVTMTSWNIGSSTMENLKAEDRVEFEFIKNTGARNGSNANTYFQAWHGATSTKQGGRIFESVNLTPSDSPDGDLMNKLLPPVILPSQTPKVSEFIITPKNPRPKPVMVFSILRNVEQNSGGDNPDAFPSRPIMLGDPALGGGAILRNAIPEDLHKAQMLVTAKTLNYANFETLASGAGGRNVYHGGGRQPGSTIGGEFQAIKRRIPLAPPLSLGAFENAIAGGFCVHFGEPNASGAWNSISSSVDPSKTGLNSVFNNGFGFPVITKAIGNSFSNPHLAPEQVFRSGSGTSTSGRVATDPSWMVNTALWDSWFLSGIVDGSGTNTASPMKDRRTPRAQFRDLAEGTGLLRNKRYSLYPHRTVEQALDELFTGDNFKGSAISQLGKYLLIDGAFNVNSTSVEAWAAMFRSVADQELLVAGGGTKGFNNPYGTIGYAANDATSGTQGDWSGLRDLSDAEITTLAENTVEEVKARGPFLSLADFVNRRPNAGTAEHKVVGALQAAIDKSGLNSRFTGGDRGLTQADLEPLRGKTSLDSEPAPARAVGAAGHLRQAGILTALGSQISVRSDTFVVRAYGDTRDKSGKVVLARAWCEAVVQRVPEFVNPGDLPEATPVSNVNKNFGRGFRLVSFRWLAPSEI
jgi:hypothetical protein